MLTRFVNGQDDKVQRLLSIYADDNGLAVGHKPNAAPFE